MKPITEEVFASSNNSRKKKRYKKYKRGGSQRCIVIKRPHLQMTSAQLGRVNLLKGGKSK